MRVYQVGERLSSTWSKYYLDKSMTEVVVTRKGQTTIPVEMRRKYAIEEGSRLEAIDTGDGILLKPEQTTADLAGSGARKARVPEMKRLLDRMRSEDA